MKFYEIYTKNLVNLKIIFPLLYKIKRIIIAQLLIHTVLPNIFIISEKKYLTNLARIEIYHLYDFFYIERFTKKQGILTLNKKIFIK